MVSVQAILFDMDGVLVDSFESWWQALNSVITSQGEEKVSREEFREKYWGHDLRDILADMGIDMTIGPFCNSIYTGYTPSITLIPGTKETLQALTQYQKGIITNTPEDCTHAILKEFDIDHFFVSVVTADEVEQGKPDPAIVYKGCSKLAVDPENVLVVGDTDFDIQAGRAAGCTTVGIGVEGDFSLTEITELTNILS
jgi:beta-phosphoglucomutase-like phosphatase (HAD superfamily)